MDARLFVSFSKIHLTSLNGTLKGRKRMDEEINCLSSFSVENSNIKVSRRLCLLKVHPTLMAFQSRFRKSRIISDAQKRSVYKVVDVLQYMSKFDYINVMIFNFRKVVPVFFPSRFTLVAAFVSTCIKIVA